ncbi:VIT1/CCC1 transporter family protein [Pseudomonas sp. NY15437]|uniref:VIT1/CCC1 transporter family protein n=1 Tax=Pseudomonas sp. NY15437 TaxID=3400360 RepID=UPI003A8885DD
MQQILEPQPSAWQRVLQDITSPFDRISEMTYGVIMTLTIISVISAASGGASRQDLIVAALGCNLAWGLVDALMLLVRLRVERVHQHGRLRALRGKSDDRDFRDGLGEFLPPRLVAALQPDEVWRLRQRLMRSELGTGPLRHGGAEVWLAALLIVLLVTGITLPLILPLWLVPDELLALRLAQGIGVAMLFGLGWLLSRWSGDSPWPGALGFTALGVAMTGLCIALGG